jgi:hypothetical protein
VAGQHGVVKVEVQRLKAVLGGWIDERIVLEALHRLKILNIQDPPDGIEGALLQLFEKGMKLIEDGEEDLVQVGQPFMGAVVPGVAHQRIVISRHALLHHERTACHLGVQDLWRLEDLCGRHTAEMVRRERSLWAIHPQGCQEGSKGPREMEGDREVVRRDLCPADQVEA